MATLFVHPPDSFTAVLLDASDVTFSGILPFLDGVMASGMFMSEDLDQSSTYHELKAIYYVLLFCVEHLRQKRVQVFTNNQGAARIVSFGSSTSSQLLRAFLIFFFQTGITLKAQLIPRSEN